MLGKVKFIVIGLCVILAISLFIAFQNYSAKEALQREKDRLNEENSLLNNKISKLQDALRDNEGKIKVLNMELEKISQEKKEIEKKYELAKRNQDELVEKLKTQEAWQSKIAKDKTDLELQLEKLRSELNDARRTKEQLQKEKSALELDIRRLTRNSQDLESGVESKESEEKLSVVASGQQIETKIAQGASVELPPIVVRPKVKVPRVTESPRGARPPRVAAAVKAPPAKKAPKIEKIASSEGKILAIIRENNFVVVDLGEEAGVKAGDVFSVYRKGKKIATIETIRTARNVAACDIKEETRSIAVGDTVK